MFAFILGCLYLSTALIYLWLIKEKFNILGFIFNPNNRNFLIIFEKLIKRLRLFLFRQQMDIYYHYKDRQDTEFLNHIRTQINYGKENL